MKWGGCGERRHVFRDTVLSMCGEVKFPGNYSKIKDHTRKKPTCGKCLQLFVQHWGFSDGQP